MSRSIDAAQEATRCIQLLPHCKACPHFRLAKVDCDTGARCVFQLEFICERGHDFYALYVVFPTEDEREAQWVVDAFRRNDRICASCGGINAY